MSDPAHGLGRSELQDLYRALVLTRTAEERLETLREQGHLTGAVYRSLGQEAGSVGAAFALRRRTDGTGDVLLPTVRAAGAMFLFGAELVDFFRQYLARGTGPTRGRDTHVHWVNLEKGIVGPVASLGTMVEVAAGIALSFRLRGEERVGMVFHGDGASSTGAWHEGLNLAVVQRCPLVLIVENNGWAVSTPTALNTRVSSFTEKGPGYGIATDSVDGTDVLAVFDSVRRAAAAARSGDGASMIELRYFRRSGDTLDDPQDYVDPEEIRAWERSDPLDRFRIKMLENDWATEVELVEIEERVHEACRAAAEQAISEPEPIGPDALADVYTDVAVAGHWYRHASPDPAMA